MVAYKAQDIDTENPAVFVGIMLVRGTLQMGRGYGFVVYECPKCTYIELHDNDPK